MQQEYFTPLDVAQRLGLSRKTIYRALRAGRLQALQMPGGDWRIKLEWVDAWMGLWLRSGPPQASGKARWGP